VRVECRTACGLRIASRLVAHGRPVLDHPVDRVRQRAGIAGLDENHGFVTRAGFPQAGCVAHDRRPGRQHGLDRGVAEWLVDRRGHDCDISARQVGIPAGLEALEAHTGFQAELRYAGAQLFFEPLVTRVHGADDRQGDHVAMPSLRDRLDQNIRPLARRQSAHVDDSQFAVEGGSRRGHPLGPDDTVVDDPRPRGCGRAGEFDRSEGVETVEHNERGEPERGHEGRSQQAAGTALRLVDMHDQGHSAHTGDEVPQRDGQCAHVDRIGAEATHADDSGCETDNRTGDESDQAAGLQYRLAHHRHGRDPHDRAASGELGCERARCGQDHLDESSVANEPGDALEQHSVGPVQLGAGMGDENSRLRHRPGLQSGSAPRAED
jgi:hypothetical protein